ncbi:hypothetical protein ALC53_04520 [Atta colombica]|uniref:Uncharacterized protein n=1 Tax=Atta colombica TaxID=520822 RepID=A0A195BLU7_9HYME|nr:hypothetical protein ALC53_04520 [Atta colombica]
MSACRMKVLIYPLPSMEESEPTITTKVLSSSLARPLINHSSTTHHLAKSPFLSLTRPPYRSRNLAVPLEGYLETADDPRSEGRRKRRANAFIYALGFKQSSRSKVDEDRRGVEKRDLMCS